MEEFDYRDINGKIPKIGDKIAYAVGWTTSNAYINTAVVKNIEATAKTLKVTVLIECCGLYRYKNSDVTPLDEGTEKVLKFPAEHCKFIIL